MPSASFELDKRHWGRPEAAMIVAQEYYDFFEVYV